MNALGVDDLRIAFGDTVPVEGVSLDVRAGSIHCLLGASGSGKTLTSLAAIGLLPPTARTEGAITLGGTDANLLTVDQRAWTTIRGARIGYVGQNALGCLHPAFRVGWQVVEAIRRHRRVTRREANDLMLEGLAAVDLRDPERVARSRPAQLSGGMCQRVALAIAICNRPQVLIADEPTTALDHETQDRVLDLIRRRVARDGLGVLMITHDHSVVEQVADEVTTIAGGRSLPATDPASVTTVNTIADVTRTRLPAAATDEPANDTTLEIEGVGKVFGRSGPFRSDAVRVLSDVTFSASAGSTVGLVGRSGSGKSTLAKIVVGALDPTNGSVRVGGRLMTGPNRVGRLERAGLVQYVFQDPFGSLNPRRSVREQVAEPLVAAGATSLEAGDRARQFLTDVGLTSAQIDRYPTTLSGGQCQRVGVARALIRRPRVVVLDEPTSALDWEIRAGLLSLLDELQHEIGATYILISHELALVERMSDVVHRIRDGRLVDTNATAAEQLSPS
ncbi:MAG: ABC transporter ATP-binding protein [Actinomycetota bacterium]